MATLTANEFRTTRKAIGDHKPTVPSGEYDLSNEEIQEQWDRADGHASEIAKYTAYYYMVELRYGIWINAVDTETAQGSKSQNQKVGSIKTLLDYYAEKAGMNAFTLQIQAGVFDFGLDQDDPITGADLEE